jgi:hypothetical protein
MNHTILATVGVLAAIISVLTATTAINNNIQTAAAYNTNNSTDPNSSNNNNNSTDIEKSTTDFKFKQKEKNNCSGFTGCDNVGTETLVPTLLPCVGTEDLVPPA